MSVQGGSQGKVAAWPSELPQPLSFSGRQNQASCTQRGPEGREEPAATTWCRGSAHPIHHTETKRVFKKTTQESEGRGQARRGSQEKSFRDHVVPNLLVRSKRHRKGGELPVLLMKQV